MEQVMQVAVYNIAFKGETPIGLSVDSVKSFVIHVETMVEDAFTAAEYAEEVTTSIVEGDGDFRFCGMTNDGTAVLCNGATASDDEHAHKLIMADSLEGHIAFQAGMNKHISAGVN